MVEWALSTNCGWIWASAGEARPTISPSYRTIMELLSLACGHCGAPLEVPDGTRYATCGYCSSKLEVRRSGGAIYTEVLEAIQKRTAEIAGEVEILKLQNQLERIDREWQAEREKCMIRGKNGSVSEPTTIGAAFLGIFCLIVGVVFLVAGTQTPPLMLFGLGGVVVGFMNLFCGTKKAQLFQEKKQRYEQRRAAACQALRNFENARR